MVDVDNRELRSTREVAREIGSILVQLEQGDLEKVVVTQAGKMRAVVLSVGAYDELLRRLA